jgi:hypothetical protein
MVRQAMVSMAYQVIVSMVHQAVTLALADAVTTNPHYMTLIQQIQLKRHVAEMLHRRGYKLGSDKAYELRVYNIYARVSQRQRA